jgi:hypothetical protein
VFIGEGEGWNGPQRETGDSIGVNKACDGPQGGSDGWDSPQREQKDSVGESEAWDGLQRDQDEPMGEPIDQFCSSCNQKKPLIDFGRFFTCNACRQRNTKANRVRKVKQKAIRRPKATREQLESSIQARGDISEYKLLKNFSTRPLTIEDYLNKSSPL